MEKKLLYYDRYQNTPKHFNGAPIVIFSFIDVKTGETIQLGECFYHQEVSELLGGKFYMEINEAVNDFDIIWKLKTQGVSPAAETFEEVQNEYLRMLNEGANPKEINQAMIKFYQDKALSLKNSQ